MSAGANKTLRLELGFSLFLTPSCSALCSFSRKEAGEHLDTVHVQQNVKSSHSKDSHPIIHILQKHRLFFLKDYIIDLSGYAL